MLIWDMIFFCKWDMIYDNCIRLVYDMKHDFCLHQSDISLFLINMIACCRYKCNERAYTTTTTTTKKGYACNFFRYTFFCKWDMISNNRIKLVYCMTWDMISAYMRHNFYLYETWLPGWQGGGAGSCNGRGRRKGARTMHGGLQGPCTGACVRVDLRRWLGTREGGAQGGDGF